MMPSAGARAATMDSAGKAQARGMVSRLLTGRVAGMLARNTVISCAAFLLDLLLLWGFVEHLEIAKLPAAAIAFLIATSVHYGFCRSWIFKGTTRGAGEGYVYFLVNAVVGLLLTLTLFWAFMAIGLHYLLARIISSLFAGLTVFLLNAVFSFRSV